jgi:DNA-binding GntR family transcriptional regulator
VVEQKFAKHFGVGQNAVREALIELAHNGFVRRVPNKGTYVTVITEKEGRKIARVRNALEGLVIDLILERLQTETIDFSEPARLLDQMKKLLDAGEMVAFYEADIAFHRALWNLARNEYLTQHLEQIVVPLFAFFIVVNIHPEQQYDDILAAVNLHGRILRGLQNRSGQESHNGMVRLLEASVRFSSGAKEKPKNMRTKRTRIS